MGGKWRRRNRRDKNGDREENEEEEHENTTIQSFHILERFSIKWIGPKKIIPKSNESEKSAKSDFNIKLLKNKKITKKSEHYKKSIDILFRIIAEV